MNSAPVGSGSGGSTAGQRRRRGAVVALLAALLIPLGSVIASPASAEISGVVLEASPSNRAVVQPGQPLTLHVTVNTSVEFASPRIRVGLESNPLSTPTLLNTWLDSAEEAPTELISILASPLATGQTAITVTVPAERIPLGADSPWGSRGLSVTLSDGDASTTAHTAFVWYPDPALIPIRVSTVVPLTAPVGSTGILTGEELTALTADGGWLSLQLAGIEQNTGAVAIDPMIIASIRLLGTTASPEVTAWFARLQALTRPTLPLAWADADLLALQAAGAAVAPLPSSLAFALDGSGLLADLTASAADPESIVLPSVAELASWPWTWPTTTWPRGGTTTAAGLQTLAGLGSDRVIVSSADVSGAIVGPEATVDELDVLVTDAGTSSAFTSAVDAASLDDWNAAIALVAVQTASASTGGAQELLVAQNRLPGTSGNRLAMTTSGLNELPWLVASSLGSAADAPALTLDDPLDDAARVTALGAIVAVGAQVDTYSAALITPELLSSDQHARTLGLSAIAWAAVPVEWTTAVADHLALSAARLDGVTVEALDSVLVVSAGSAVPVSVINKLAWPVQVVVSITPSNNRLLVEDTVTMTIAPDSKQTAKVPVRSIANGTAQLKIEVSSAAGFPPGVLLDEPTWTTVTVRAEWETIGVGLLVVAMVLLFGFGIWRNLRRRRSEKAASEPPVVEPVGNESTDG